MFKELVKNENLLASLEKAGYEEPTGVQKNVIPKALEGKDLIVQSKTGTGKTASFVVPVLEETSPEDSIKTIVIVPTRELATQVTKEFRKLGNKSRVKALAIYGGQKIDIQINALRNYRNQIIVGTPGRIVDHLQRKTIKLNDIENVILDEADRMLDMGFEKDLTFILSHTPKDRQTLLFSATMPNEIKKIARKYMNNPEEILLSEDKVSLDTIDQSYYYVRQKEKFDVIQHVLERENPHLAIVFCKTKKMVDILTRFLRKKKYHVKSIHGDFTQRQRERALKDFSNKETKENILVATDVASRGLHVENVDLVVNYDLPMEAETYVHRIGRTGRMGKTGKAISIATPETKRVLSQIENLLGESIRKEKDFETKIITHKRTSSSYDKPRFM